MKEHKQDSSKMQEQQQQQQGSEQAGSGASSGAPKVLKSLLKKPGQQQGSGSKGRKGKNRVVINEKMNEFFAADYIILIKEECCAEYEEECDCCCQEHEMIRLGNCKECRAELNLPPYECGPDDACEDDEDDDDDDDEGLCHRRGHEEDDDEDEDEGEEEEEDEVDDDMEDQTTGSESESKRQPEPCSDHEPGQMCARQLVQLSKVQPGRNRQQQLRETLSPPEGYKDLCEAAQARQRLDEAEAAAAEAAAAAADSGEPVCAECDYYQRQAEAAAAAAAAATNTTTSRSVNGSEIDATDSTKTPLSTDGDESRVSRNEQQQQLQLQKQAEEAGGTQLAIDQSQQPTTDVSQRYLVETITMTTVTERRIVREISSGGTGSAVNGEDGEVRPAIDETDGSSATTDRQHSPQSNGNAEIGNESRDEEKQQSVLPFKTLLPSNSLKPNSALRQLFPDPRFISPPPAPTRSASLDPGGDSGSGSEQQADSTQQLNNGDNSANGKLSGRSESLDCSGTGGPDSNIKRAIERNALRRSLVARYDGAASLRRRQHQHHGQSQSGQQNNLRSKDLSLEERIRQLTCVNDDDDDENANGSGDNQQHHQFHLHPNHLQQQQLPNGRIGGHHHHHHHHQHQHQHLQEDYRQQQLGTRTSPSGEERPNSGCVQGKPPPGPQHNHHHHQHTTNSAYRKITDLFSGQRNKNSSGSSSSSENMPDIGLGSKQQQQSSGNKSNNNRQFLSSLAPLSCVAANSASAADQDRDDQPYYRARPGPKPGSHQQQRQHGGSGYSLEDIEHALNSEAPDVTRGTPTSAQGGGFERLLPSSGGEANGDEMLAAFVEQDRSRTERIRRRYNDPVDSTSQQQLDPLDGFEIPRNHVIQQRNGDPKHNGQAASNEDDDEDDELNDYGFNRRPSVRGIKAQFETTNEIVRQLRTRSAAANSLPEACRLGLPAAASIGASNTSLEPGELLKQETAGYRLAYSAEQHGQLAVDPNNTISRINNMQRQINDIYQSIAESGVAAALLGAGVGAGELVQANPRPASYLDAAGTLPRVASDPSRRYLTPASSLDQQPHQLSTVAAAATGMYSTLPKNHRPHPSAATGIPQQQLTYSAGSSIVSASVAGTPPKCYRTMYFVPHNGSTTSLEPTYYSVQMPPSSSSSSPSYAEQIERYPPYPRNTRIDQQQQQQRYYLRPASVPNTGSASSALQLHLQQSEELQQQVARSAGLQHSLQQQQQPQQQSSLDCSSVSSSSTSSAYNVQTLSGVTYSICPPPPPMSSTTTYTYQMQIQGRLSSGSSDLSTTQQLQQQQSLSGLSQLAANASLLASSGSLSSINSSLLSSPTKQPLGSSHTSIHQQLQPALQQQGCSVAERGVPEGAASAPAHDYSSYMVSTGDGLVPDSNTQNQSQNQQQSQQHQQNPVYYAMNV